MGQYIKESDLINNTFNCHYINLSTSRSIDEIGRKPVLKLWRYLFIIIHLFGQLALFRPHLCYAAITVKGLAFYKDLFLVFLIKIFGVQIVYHLHNKGISTRQNNIFDDFFYQFVFKNSYIILLSKYLYSDIKKYMLEERVFYCPNGTPDIQHIERDIEIKKTEFLFLSNLIESKGVFILLDACKFLKEEGLPFHCNFIGSEGDITYKRLLQKIDMLELTNFVSCIGGKYGRDKDEYFKNAHIFVFPTYYHNECFPLVLLEAMQCGLPVISTYEGGIPDIVVDRETGFLVPPKNAFVLAGKLEILINNPIMCKNMGDAGRLRYEQNFRLDIFEMNLKNILDEVLEK
jgi:glycosyltransferase involved in cell wall biosynthesis